MKNERFTWIRLAVDGVTLLSGFNGPLSAVR